MQIDFATVLPGQCYRVAINGNVPRYVIVKELEQDPGALVVRIWGWWGDTIEQARMRAEKIQDSGMGYLACTPDGRCLHLTEWTLELGRSVEAADYFWE